MSWIRNTAEKDGITGKPERPKDDWNDRNEMTVALFVYTGDAHLQ
jgi:hypothetical protein